MERWKAYIETIHDPETNANWWIRYTNFQSLYDEVAGTNVGAIPKYPFWSLICRTYEKRDVYAPYFYRWYTQKFEEVKARFYELLRIEVKDGKYNWLVTEYQELLHTGADTGTTRDERDTTGKAQTSGDDITKRGGADTTTRGGTDVTDTTDHTETSDTTDGTNISDSYTDAIGLSKTNPMSITYSTGIEAIGTTGQAIGNNTKTTNNPLDWSNPSTQSENFGRGASKTTTHDVTTGSSDSTGKSTATHNATDTMTYGSTSTLTHGAVTDTTGRDESTRTLDTLHTDKEQRRGRNARIAELLSEAQEFISNSSAWLWLKNQLDTIFIGIYDIDRYEELAETDDFYSGIENEWRG